MAIYNGRILMRKGNEADFDPSKLMSGEWAVSLDAGIVRICLEAGKVIRMATYEAFEEDMKQIEAILLECQSIEEAVRRINTEVSEKLNACAEYVQQAKNYSEQAKTSEANSKSYMQSAKTSEENAKVSETNAKASENSAKEYENSAKLTEERAREVFESIPEDYSTISNDLYELAIKETASGEEIHVNDSSNLKLREFALYGKAKQNTTSGKNLVSDDWEQGILSVDNGTSISSNSYWIHTNKYVEVDSTKQYTISGDTTSSATIYLYDENKSFLTTLQPLRYVGTPSKTITIPEKTKYVRFGYNYSGATETITPEQMGVLHWLQFEEGTVATEYEPYTGGIASPNPDYPQPIEVSGESYNLLENTATSQEKNGITFTVNNDKSVTLNKTSTSSITYVLNNTSIVDLPNGDYTLSCEGLTTASTYFSVLMSDGTNTSTAASATEKTFSVTDNNKIQRVYFWLDNNVTCDNITLYPMIRKASVKNDRYMPYGVGSVEVQSHGENLCDIQEATTMHKLPFPLKAGTYTISFKTTATQGGFRMSNTTNTSLNSIGKVSNVNSNGYAVITITTTFVTNYINISATPNNDVAELMLNKGTTPLPYEPYKETLSTIPTENGLASANNARDEKVKYADGSGESIQRVVTVVFDGSEDEEWKLSDFFDVEVPDRKLSQNVICSHYINEMNWSKFVNGNYKMFAPINHSWLRFNNSDFDSLEAWKENLNSNPITVIYELATPITTPLTAEEIAEIEKLHTFYPITNISNDFDCGMSVTYYCDSKNYINNQLAIMKQEQEEAMMNMLLLMPTEVQAMMIENDTNDLLKESEI